MTAADTFRKLKDVFGQVCCSYCTVYHWFKSFKSGRSKLGDQYHGSRHWKRTDDKIQKCQELVLCNRRSSINHLSHQLGMSYRTVFTILHKDLELKKRPAKMIPHALTYFYKRRHLEFAHSFLAQYSHDKHCLKWVMTTDESWFHIYDPRSKFDNMVWMQKDENRPQVLHRPMGTPKGMLVPFFDAHGLVHWEFCKGCTINKHHFLAMLQRVKTSIRLRRGTRVWHNQSEYMLHMDNALAHCSDLVQSYLRNEGWPVLKHPPTPPTFPLLIFFFFLT